MVYLQTSLGRWFKFGSRDSFEYDLDHNGPDLPQNIFFKQGIVLLPLPSLEYCLKLNPIYICFGLHVHFDQPRPQF